MSKATCRINGDAEVTVDFERKTLVWSRADDAVHVHDELLSNTVARRRLSTMYFVGERCPYGKTTRHARRRRDGIRASDLAVVDAGVAEALDKFLGGA